MLIFNETEIRISVTAVIFARHQCCRNGVIDAIYQNEGDSFIPNYKDLLRSTGEGKVADLAGRFGIDVKSKDFWADSLKLYEGQIDKYCGL